MRSEGDGRHVGMGGDVDVLAAAANAERGRPQDHSRRASTNAAIRHTSVRIDDWNILEHSMEHSMCGVTISTAAGAASA